MAEAVDSMFKNLNKNTQALGVGTAYALTTSPEAITFGTSGALAVTLPEPGTYLIEVAIVEDLSGLTASAAANYSLYQLYDSVAAGLITSTERLGTLISIIASAIVGITGKTTKLLWIVTTTTANDTLTLYGKKNSATTGDWTITTGATGQSVMSYVRLR